MTRRVSPGPRPSVAQQAGRRASRAAEPWERGAFPTLTSTRPAWQSDPNTQTAVGSSGRGASTWQAQVRRPTDSRSRSRPRSQADLAGRGAAGRPFRRGLGGRHVPSCSKLNTSLSVSPQSACPHLRRTLCAAPRSGSSPWGYQREARVHGGSRRLGASGRGQRQMTGPPGAADTCINYTHATFTLIAR